MNILGFEVIYKEPETFDNAKNEIVKFIEQQIISHELVNDSIKTLSSKQVIYLLYS